MNNDPTYQETEVRVDNPEMLDLIRRRRSVRTFDNKPLSEDDQTFIVSSLEKAKSLSPPFGTDYTMDLIPLTPHERDRLKRSDYGFIVGEQGFIVGLCENRKESLIDLGHAMESVVLDLTSRGIGTCWMVSTFKRSTISEKVVVKEGQILAAIIAYGYPSHRSSLYERFSTMMVRSQLRMAWDRLFFAGDFNHPIGNDDCPWASHCLEAVRMAPSGNNKQPWRLVVDGESLHLYIERTHAYASKRLGFDMQYLDMGIAMFHMESICGDECHWSFDEPGLDTPNVEYEYIATLNLK